MDITLVSISFAQGAPLGNSQFGRKTILKFKMIILKITRIARLMWLSWEYIRSHDKDNATQIRDSIQSSIFIYVIIKKPLKYE